MLLTAWALAGCAHPPATAYLDHSKASGAKITPAIALGRNAAKEDCAAAEAGGTYRIYCGSWQEPSAVVRQGPPSTAAGLAVLAESSPWRAALEQRYQCGSRRPTTILGDHSAVLLACVQRLGGWPHVALVALVGGRAYFADGVQPAFPVIQRGIGVASGILSRRVARTASVGTDDQVLASRLAAEAFSSGDIGQYDALMRVANNAGQAEEFAAAATAYRAALALQQRSLGIGNPNTVSPMIDLALSLSDEGRFNQAEGLFADAAALAPYSADPTAAARLLHYRGLDQLNQRHPRRALALLRRAEAQYVALLPREVWHPRIEAVRGAAMFGLAGDTGGSAAYGMTETSLLSPVTQQALLGALETLRYQAIAETSLGKSRHAAMLMAQVHRISLGNGFASPVFAARLDRTTAAIEEAGGHAGSAAARLALAGQDFALALPGSRPVADTYLLRGAALAEAGQIRRALVACRHGVTLLEALRLGTSAAIISPCLAVADTEARRQPGAAQPLYAEMFRMAELAQGSTTSAQIAEAAARLAVDGKNPKVAAAIRAHQDAVAALAHLYRERDQFQRRTPTGAGVKTGTKASLALDAAIVAANRRLAQADLAVQAAAPNFGQLVQQVVPARAVLARLAPDEAFIDIMLAPRHAWLFMLTNGRIIVRRSGTGLAAMTHLVRQVRRSIEPSQAGLPPFALGAAATIYSATLGQFPKQMPGIKALVVAPSGPLLSLPFALLPMHAAQATDLAAVPWLIRRMSLAYVPAAANFVSLRKIQGVAEAPEPWFGFGDFHPVTLAQAKGSFAGPACRDSAALFANLPSLPDARLELAAARAIFHAGEGDELLGAQFTVPNIEAADLARYRILHFATHALLPSDLPCEDQPAIITSSAPGARSARSAMLTSADITNLRLDADLVILDACNTGGGDGRSGGQALSGLARSFFFAGAKALMVTQWPVNDRIAAYLVADTLQKLNAETDGGAAGSLRAAQLALIDGAGHGLPAAIANPFYWAPYVVIGDGGKSARSAFADIIPSTARYPGPSPNERHGA